MNVHPAPPHVQHELKLIQEDPQLGSLTEYYREVRTKHPEWHVGICTARDGGVVGWDYHVSLMHMFKTPFNTLGKRGIYLHYQRCQLALETLEDSRVTHILWADSDQFFPPWTLMRLLQHDKAIIGGLVMKGSHPYHYAVYAVNPKAARYSPIDLIDRDNFPRLKKQYRHKRLEVAATGCGCLLVRREVFEELPKPWFDTPIKPDMTSMLGEDIYFCTAARRAGLDIYIDTSIICEHTIKSMHVPYAFRQGLIALGSGVPMEEEPTEFLDTKIVEENE